MAMLFENIFEASFIVEKYNATKDDCSNLMCSVDLIHRVNALEHLTHLAH